MNDCQDFEELIDLASTDEVQGPDRWRLEAHLASCAGCRAQLAETRWIARLVRQEFADEESFVAAGVRRHSTRNFARPALALAAGLLLAAGWWMSGAPRRDKPADRSQPSAPTIAAIPPAPTADDELDFAALERLIDREASAAELAASAEVLADVPGGYAEDSWRLVAHAFPETKAGQAAARRLGSD
jgi:hypothetical protein